MLDPYSGYLSLSPTANLRPGEALEAACALLVAETLDLRAMQTGWQWLLARNVQVTGLYYVLNLGFYHQQLRRVTLVVSPTRFPSSATWAGWSAEGEARSLAVLKHWIRAEVGQEGDFPWGTVTATYDPRNAGSSVIINYRHPS